jgi:hypothetical protein
MRTRFVFLGGHLELTIISGVRADQVLEY